MSTPDPELLARLRATINEISPQLGVHGGSVEFVDFSPDGVLSILFTGACEGCMAAEYTLEYGIKELILIKHPEVEDVVAANTEPKTHLPPAIPISYAPAL